MCVCVYACMYVCMYVCVCDKRLLVATNVLSRQKMILVAAPANDSFLHTIRASGVFLLAVVMVVVG